MGCRICFILKALVTNVLGFGAGLVGGKNVNFGGNDFFLDKFFFKCAGSKEHVNVLSQVVLWVSGKFGSSVWRVLMHSSSGVQD